jgi:hypothetical protein
VRWQRLLLVLILVAVAAAVWSRLRPSEPRRVLRQLDRLAERISKTESESTAIMALKLNGLGDLFAAEVEVDLADFPGNGTYASSEVASHVARFRPACRSLALSFHDTRITIGPPAQAEATFTARLHVTATNGDPQTDTRALRVRLQRDADKSWRFTRFEEIRVLQR